jgi:hypothetical protein
MTSSRDRRAGQILPLFVLSLVAILAMAALLFDGANALAARRQLQNAGDAAALAGSNVIQATGSIRACSATAGPPPGAPRSDIVAAVLASIDANIPGFDHAKVSITCPDGWSNQAVRVTLAREAVGWFAGAIGAGPLDVTTASTAVNGRVATTKFSVVLLDPSNSGWPNGRRGCPAFLISGGPQITFEGSVQINSACTAANGGALSTNGNSATVTMNNSATINMVGGYAPGPLTITPTPTTGAKSLKDPLADLDPPPYTTMTVRSNSRLVLNNATQVLEPGVYRGGIQLRNSSVALLRPGIYVMDGGGLDLGAQASMCSISATSTVTNCTGTLASFCPDTSCGVLLYNRGTQNGSNAMGQVTIGAGATLKLRSYDERAMGSAFAEYRNLLLWQDASPVPLSNWAQPTVALGGGGSVDLGGTVYAPSALVYMTGGSGGGGGSATNVTLQFIAWDLQIQGNSTFNFFYNSDEFARPTDYGLVE